MVSKYEEVEKGVSATTFLGKINSLRMVSNRGSVSLIDYELLEKSTQNFGDENLLGKGGFGRVYKALLEDDKHVAVKKLDCAGEDARREFEVPYLLELLDYLSLLLFLVDLLLEIAE